MAFPVRTTAQTASVLYLFDGFDGGKDLFNVVVCLLGLFLTELFDKRSSFVDDSAVNGCDSSSFRLDFASGALGVSSQ